MDSSKIDFTAKDLYDFLVSVKDAIPIDNIPLECGQGLNVSGVCLSYRTENSPYVHLISDDISSSDIENLITKS